jgi:hypothetical protein
MCPAGAGYETALTSRFAPAAIRRALELLRRQGALETALRGGRQVLQLTGRWRAQLQVRFSGHARSRVGWARQASFACYVQECR